MASITSEEIQRELNRWQAYERDVNETYESVQRQIRRLQEDRTRLGRELSAAQIRLNRPMPRMRTKRERQYMKERQDAARYNVIRLRDQIRRITDEAMPPLEEAANNLRRLLDVANQRIQWLEWLQMNPPPSPPAESSGSPSNGSQPPSTSTHSSNESFEPNGVERHPGQHQQPQHHQQ